jgi:hypothetical protein
MEKPSWQARESMTRSLSTRQKGHFMVSIIARAGGRMEGGARLVNATFISEVRTDSLADLRMTVDRPNWHPPRQEWEKCGE